MSLKISDMVLVPQGVYLYYGDEWCGQKLTVTSQPNYGIIIPNKKNINSLNDHLHIVIGDTKYYVAQEDVFPCL